MNAKKLSLTVFIIISLLALINIAYCCINLPTHTDPTQDQSSKRASTLTFSAITAATIASFFIIALIIPKIPDSMINLPNKDYWLAEERKTQTFDTFTTYFLWFASASTLHILHISNVIYKPNPDKLVMLTHIIISASLHMTAMTVIAVALLIKFRKKPQPQEPRI